MDWDDKTKQELISALKTAGVKMGDYDRKTKQQLIDLATVHAAALAKGAPPVVDAPAQEPVAAILHGGHAVAAKYPGICKACSGTFVKGDLISRNGLGKWVHEGCAVKDDAPLNLDGRPQEGVIGEDVYANLLPHIAVANRALAKQQARIDAEAQGNSPQPSPEDADMFVVAVRDAVASNGSTGAEMIVDVAARVFAEMSDRRMDQIEKAVEEKIAAMPKPEQQAQAPQAAPAEIIVKVAGAPAINLEGIAHPLFEKVLKLAAAKQNVLLVGPAGCGKTHLAAQVAKALGKAFSSNSVSSGMSESALTGYLLPVGDAGRFEYVSVPFVDAYKNGGVHLIDELDGGDANVFLTMNSALSNGSFSIPQRVGDHVIARHPEFVCIAAANTFGHGADMMYVGRNQLDAATLDRFYVVPMDYDRMYERSIAPVALCTWVWGIRDKARECRLRRVVSTRMLQRMAAGLAAGLSASEVRGDALAGWSKDDLAKVGGIA